jgi:hypothetical protein
MYMVQQNFVLLVANLTSDDNTTYVVNLLSSILPLVVALFSKKLKQDTFYVVETDDVI